jgi:hypothetical protein
VPSPGSIKDEIDDDAAEVSFDVGDATPAEHLEQFVESGLSEYYNASLSLRQSLRSVVSTASTATQPRTLLVRAPSSRAMETTALPSCSFGPALILRLD